MEGARSPAAAAPASSNEPLMGVIGTVPRDAFFQLFLAEVTTEAIGAPEGTKARPRVCLAAKALGAWAAQLPVAASSSSGTEDAARGDSFGTAREFGGFSEAAMMSHGRWAPAEGETCCRRWPACNGDTNADPGCPCLVVPLSIALQNRLGPVAPALARADLFTSRSALPEPPLPKTTMTVDRTLKFGWSMMTTGPTTMAASTPWGSRTRPRNRPASPAPATSNPTRASPAFQTTATAK